MNEIRIVYRNPFGLKVAERFTDDKKAERRYNELNGSGFTIIRIEKVDKNYKKPYDMPISVKMELSIQELIMYNKVIGSNKTDDEIRGEFYKLMDILIEIGEKKQ